MPFQKGNKHGQRARDFEKALRKVIAQEDPEALRKVTRKVLDLALGGEKWAVEMIRDTLDGRPVPQIDQQLNTTGDVYVTQSDSNLA